MSAAHHVEDLRKLYSNLTHGVVNGIDASMGAMLIERIAALEAQVAHLESACDTFESKLADSYRENAQLQARVAALSKPVSESEYFDRCIIGDGNKAVSVFNRIIAARLKAEEAITDNRKTINQGV